MPGNEMGEVGKLGGRFLDNQRIEGSVPEMLQGGTCQCIGALGIQHLYRGDAYTDSDV